MNNKLYFLFFNIATTAFINAQSGFVGINTSTPSATLDIVSKGNNASTKALKISNSSNTEMLTVLDNGQVGINQPNPEASALMELRATDKALLLTRVANASDVSFPVNGMMVYDIALKCVRGYENGAWSSCLSGGGSTSNPSTSGAGSSCESGELENIKTFGLDSFANGQPYHDQEYGAYFISQTGKFYSNTGYILDESYYGEVTAMSDVGLNQYFAHTAPVNRVTQMYPTTTWKQFTNTNFDSGKVGSTFTMLSNDGKIVVWNGIRNQTCPTCEYPLIMGPSAVNKTPPTDAQITAGQPAFPMYEINAYSAVGTQTATNWGWFTTQYQINNGATGAFMLNIAYNKADNLFYTWGGLSASSGSTYLQTATPTNVKTLLRTASNTLINNATPLPATILNNVLTQLGTTIKETTDKLPTISAYYYVNANSTPGTNNAFYHFNFVTADGRIVSLNPDNGNYFLSSLPGGVKATAVMTPQGNDYTVNQFILGDNGKLYYAQIYDKRAASQGDTSIVYTLANSNAATQALSFKQIIMLRYDTYFGLTDSGEIYLVYTTGTYTTQAPINITTSQTMPLVDSFLTDQFTGASIPPVGSTSLGTSSYFNGLNVAVKYKGSNYIGVLWPHQSNASGGLAYPTSTTTTSYFLRSDGKFARYNVVSNTTKATIFYNCFKY